MEIAFPVAISPCLVNTFDKGTPTTLGIRYTDKNGRYCQYHPRVKKQ